MSHDVRNGALIPSQSRGAIDDVVIVGGGLAGLFCALKLSPAERFPAVHTSCMAAGIDPARDPIPIAPAAHDHMGGIAVDARGRSSLDGLWAAGEVASTGAHGANRMASNSLLEAVVFANRIAEDVEALPPRQAPPRPDVVEVAARRVPAPPARETELRQLMSVHLGVIRNEAGLAYALHEMMRIERESASPALRNMAIAALVIAAAAWRRRESRGAHYRSDHPAIDQAQGRRSFLTLEQARALALTATEGRHAPFAAA